MEMSITQELNEIGGEILDASIVVHRHLGPGLLESCYRMALGHELQERGLAIVERVKVPLTYKGRHLGHGFEIDLLVENAVIIETKSVDVLHPVATAQLITYLKLSKLHLGYLINFNVPLLKDGFHRIVYNL